MHLDLLEYSIQNNNIDKAMSIIADIGANKCKEATPILIKYLQSTDDNSLRNEIAIALSDIGCPEAVEPIINMIKSPKTVGNRGTLLFALVSFDYSSHIMLLVDLLFDDNFEVSRQSFVLIESIVNDLPDEIKQICTMKIRNKLEDLQDKIDFLTESLNVFKEV